MSISLAAVLGSMFLILAMILFFNYQINKSQSEDSSGSREIIHIIESYEEGMKLSSLAECHKEWHKEQGWLLGLVPGGGIDMRDDEKSGSFIEDIIEILFDILEIIADIINW